MIAARMPPTLGPDELLFEAAYLVARGVRPLAIVGSVPATPEAMSRAEQALHRCGALYGNTCPTVFVRRGESSAACGYASHAWVLDLYVWATEAKSVPLRQRERVIGLLLGYSAEAIRDFDERQGALAHRNWSVGGGRNP